MTDRYLLNPFFLDEALPDLEDLAGAGWRVNRPELPESALQDRISAIHRPLADAVAETVRDGERPILVAGDCCAAIAVAAGLGRAGALPALVWLDAHGDFNTWETTSSGFLGGMPLAMLVGRGDPTLMDAVGCSPLTEERVVLTDARDLDPGEKELLEGSEVRHLPDPRLLLGEELPGGPSPRRGASTPLWVHFDVDIVDPGDVPAVLYPALGGRPAAELEEVFRSLAARREVAAVSLSSWNPTLDRDGRSREICLSLLQALTG